VNSTKQKNTSYADAGVNIDRGNQLLERIKSAAASTHGSPIIGGLGGFGALYDLSKLTYKNPVLVSGTDGVGTKLKIAIQMDRHDTIGIDLVAMCVNDLLVHGAEPLFFLDYFACGSLNVEVTETVIQGIVKGCQIAGCALTGGETAEMPGMYSEGEYDLAGFCVGVVEKEKIINDNNVKEGNTLIGIMSNGAHANGYSLIRKILEDTGTTFDQSFEESTFGEILLTPTRIYVSSIIKLINTLPVNSLAHITGGGLIENIPRVIPKELKAVIDTDSWQWPSIFNWLKQDGNVDALEMYRIFNCGIGMVVIIDKAYKKDAIECLSSAGECVYEIGTIQKRSETDSSVHLLTL
jgi:phosphoribosylformylglycinamidine cyclo-ligase